MFVSNVAATARNRPSVTAAHPQLARALWQWLALGVLLLAMLPAARGPGLWFGSGTFWLLGAPLSSLLVFYRHLTAAAWRGVFVPVADRRRPRGPGRQARRVGFGSRAVKARQRAA